MDTRAEVATTEEVSGSKCRRVASLAAGLLLCSGCYVGAEGPSGGGAATESGGGPGGSSDPEASTAGADETGGGDESGGSSGEDDAPNEACLEELAARPLIRLNPVQLRNTQRDLFGDPELEPSYADVLPVITDTGVRQLRATAESVLARRDNWGVEVFPCSTDGEPDDACAAQFIDEFGPRAFRRPLTDSDRQWLQSVYESAVYSEELTFSDALDTVLAAMLQAPDHIYLRERGSASDDLPDGVLALSDHEFASRLSYFLWDTMPDEELRAAADAGELTTAAGRREQVERMLASERAEENLQTFFGDWLKINGGEEVLVKSLEETEKDPALFPEFDPALADAMRVELEAFVQSILYGEEDATLSRFFTDRSAYVNRALADLYGVEGPVDDDTWEWVELDPSQRSGILTRAGFLTVFGHYTAQAPIRRGVHLLEDVLCIELGEPDPDANDTPPEGDSEAATIREEVELRTAGTCQNCHRFINPFGFVFENYDAIGRWQDDEVVSGNPVDPVAELLTSDIAGPAQNALDLSERLATSEQAKECFASTWASSAFSAELEELDSCVQGDVIDAFVETGDIRELIVSIVLSQSFRHIRRGE